MCRDDSAELVLIMGLVLYVLMQWPEAWISQELMS
jgi:hypothetical protein